MIERFLDAVIQTAIVGFVGAVIVEWFNSSKGFEKFITPLHDKVIRRYEYVQNRNK